jgi:hypothetical protein
MAMFVLASLLILSTAAVEMARQQWDLAVAVLVAFALSLLAAVSCHSAPSMLLTLLGSRSIFYAVSCA